MLIFRTMRAQQTPSSSPIPGICLADSGVGRTVCSRAACRILTLGVVAWSLGSVSGCSTSAEDEYYRIRGIVIVAEPGDGATLTSIGPAGSFRESNAGAAVALGRPPKTASDQRLVSE